MYTYPVSYQYTGIENLTYTAEFLVIFLTTAVLALWIWHRRKWTGRLLFLTVLALVATLLFTLRQMSHQIAWITERGALAAEMGADLTRYFPPYFPASYYTSVLEEGTPREEVHAAVQHYKRVVHCGPGSEGGTSEIYYFYSDNDDAVRMELVYNSEGLLSRGDTEDKNSGRFYTDKCQPGQWE